MNEPTIYEIAEGFMLEKADALCVDCKEHCSLMHELDEQGNVVVTVSDCCSSGVFEF